MKRLVLIDGHAILYRAFHALPHMTNSKKQPTNAVYGFVSMLLRVIEDLKPSHLIVCFDMPGPTFRNKMYDKYQAHRPKMDDALKSQIGLVHDVVEAFDIPIFEKSGYEADDLMGTIAHQAQGKKRKVKSIIDEVVIVTGDRDLLQLVTDKVKLYMPVKGLSQAKLFGEKEAKQRMGVDPSQVVDLKGLMGDSSDNYPGISGVGPKTAITLLETFGSIENIYKNIEKVNKKSLKEKLQQGKENAFLSKELAAIKQDAPVTFNNKSAELPPDLLTDDVIEAFGKLGFKSLLRRLTKMVGREAKQENKKQPRNRGQMGLF